MILICFFDLLVASLCNKTSVGKEYLTFTVVDFDNLGFHRITDFSYGSEIEIAVIGVFISCDDAVSFISNVKNNFVFFDFDDFALNYLPISDSLKCLI